jgi:hypothetical protein
LVTPDFEAPFLGTEAPCWHLPHPKQSFEEGRSTSFNLVTKLRLVTPDFEAPLRGTEAPCWHLPHPKQSFEEGRYQAELGNEFW